MTNAKGQFVAFRDKAYWRDYHNKYQKARLAKRTPMIGTLKNAFGGCMDCGFNGPPEALDFDHRPGEVKLFEIARAVHYPWWRILEEMNKCDLVCANCHRIRTRQRTRQRQLVNA